MAKFSKKSVQRKSPSAQVIDKAIMMDGIVINPHTSRCVDLKILKSGSSYIPINEKCSGTLIHDAPGHYDFISRSLERKLLALVSKSECLRTGQFINVKKNLNEIIYPTIRHGLLYNEKISFAEFCVAAAKELLEVANLRIESNS